jgi:hypothetical protein
MCGLIVGGSMRRAETIAASFAALLGNASFLCVRVPHLTRNYPNRDEFPNPS